MSAVIWLALAGGPGSLVPGDAAAVPVADRGLLYGDGLFETVRVYGGRAPLWLRHAARLRAAAARLGLPVPWSDGELLAGALAACAAAGVADGGFRLTLTRGAGPRGFAPPPDPRPTAIVQPFPFQPPLAAYQRGWRLYPASVRACPGSPAWELKSLSALDKVVARREAAAAGADDALICNVHGHVTEGTACNLFWVRDGVIHTPDPACGLLAGVARGLVLELAAAAGLPVRQGAYPLAHLAGATEVFATNALVEVMPVATIDGVGRWAPGPVAALLRQRYGEYVSTNC